MKQKSYITRGFRSIIFVLLSSIPLLGLNQTYVQVDPNSQNVELSQGFTVYIQIGDVANLFAFAVDVYYDPAIVDPTTIVEGDFLSENGATNTFFQYSVDDVEGKIIIGISRSNPSLPGVSASSPETAVTINFATIGIGTSQIDLENVGLLAPDGVTNYPANVYDGLVTVFELNQSVNVSISPAQVQMETNEQFTLDIVLGPVNDLMSFATEINYNPMVVQLNNATQGTFLNENGSIQTTLMKSIDNQAGNCVLGLTRITNPPSGVSSTQNNVVITLYFSTNNPGTTQIDLDNVGLINPNGVTYYTPITSNGEVVVEQDPNSATLTFNPDDFSLFPDQAFNTTIKISDVQNLFGTSIDVMFDPGKLEVTEVIEGDFLNEDGGVQTTFLYDIDNVNGVLIVGITRFYGNGGVSTTYPKNLFEVKFNTKDVGSSQLLMSNIGLLEPDGVTTVPYVSTPADVNVLSTEGTIYGVIIDSETGLPISGATVYATGGFYSNQPSNANGEYLINVPFGLGYHVFASAYTYNGVELTDVHVRSTQPLVEENIELDPLPQVYSISEIIPDPNPVISKVIPESTVHRYYQINYEGTNIPAPDVFVGVSSDDMNYMFVSDENGFVDLSIPSTDIGNGQIDDTEDFQIYSVNSENLTIPINFSCEVESPVFSKSWRSYKYGDLSVSHFSVFENKGSKTTLINENPNFNDAEKIKIARQIRHGSGASVSVGATAYVQMGEIYNGIDASAGLGVKIAGVFEDVYKFDHQNTNDWEAIAKYILISNGIFDNLDQPLIRLLTVLEENFTNQTTLDDAYISDKNGIDVLSEASAYANLGIAPAYIAGVYANGDIGVEGHVATNVAFHRDSNETESDFGVSGTFATASNAGIVFSLPENEILEGFKNNIKIHDFDGTRGMSFSVFNDESTLEFTKFQIKFLHKKEYQGWEEVVTYTISGDDVYLAIETIKSQIEIICNPSDVLHKIEIPNDLFQNLTIDIFNELHELQQDEFSDVVVSYEIERSETTHTESFPVGIGIGLDFLLELSGSVGVGSGFEESKTAIIESGKWIKGNEFVMNEFNNNYIPNINEEYDDVFQEIVNNVPLNLRVLIGTLEVLSFLTDDTQFTIGDNGSFIIIPDGAIPPALDSITCTSWSWYGNSPSKMLSDVPDNKKEIFTNNKQKAEAAYGMKYGIGGFYQFEPYSTELLDTCYITIFYQDSSVVNIDELSLGIYKENKSQHRWEYVGGLVDTANNSITADVFELSTFTIAPRSPYGSFGLIPQNDSIYADSISTVIVNSELLYNNDSTIVEDGELYTVNAETGTIISTDIEPTVDGIQVSVISGIIEFEVLSSKIASVSELSAFSLNGSATGMGHITYYDTIPPQTPSNLIADIGNESVQLHWNENYEIDIAGYKVYFNSNNPNPPYTGVASVYGQPSPITLGVDTAYSVLGLFNDTTYCFSVTAFDVSGNESGYAVPVCAVPSGIELNVKTYLEGPFNGFLLMPHLYLNGAIPLYQPYNNAPWYYNGQESVLSFPSVIVDWVLVELRETIGDSLTATSNKVIARKAAFIKSDGTIVGRDGDNLHFDVAVTKNLYVVIWHRNHLGIMSANPVTETGGIYTYDFTTSETQTFGGLNSVKELVSGKWGMIAADGNADGMIDNLDLVNIWKPQAGEAGYKPGDYNMDTEVDNKDKDDVWVPNEGKGSEVPE